MPYVELKQTFKQNTRLLRSLIVGALGRCSRGAGACCSKLRIVGAEWDRAETAYSPDGFYPEILRHDISLDAALAAPEMGHS
ncbi:MAG: hypothetical protein HRT36_02735 [Alphaproteobacteria bacterium]|nr:hypothetical protein [Alphaproteobacteria bacterium]